LRNNEGVTVAHSLAVESKLWSSSMASQRSDVLQLLLQDQTSVAHSLAFHQPSWGCTDAAKDMTFLLMKDNLGSSVAHTLARRNTAWVNDVAIGRKEILMIDSPNFGNVSQIAMTESFEKGRLLYALASHGFAYRSSECPEIPEWRKPIIQLQDLHEYSQLSMADIAGGLKHESKARKLIVFYATLENIRAHVQQEASLMFINQLLVDIGEQILSILNDYPNVINELTTLVGINCEPAINFINHSLSEQMLGNITGLFEEQRQSDTNIDYSLY
jgi:hypothetical protein